MLIKQFQFTGMTEEEREIIPEFCEWLCLQMFEYINTKMNRRKIQLRISYLYNVSWIQWNKTKYIDVQTIMDTIYESFVYEEYKDNTWKIFTNANILIPGTNTLIDRLIRFINYGDTKVKGTGIFTKLQDYFKFHKLNQLWRMFISSRLQTMITDVKIITD